MATITLLALQGLERGSLYQNLKVPCTIGREEDNAVQLNDERISRCHLKLQEDEGHIILTDLESTNGTRVNGLPVKMTILRPGDLITLGRCVLLFGSEAEIREHCHELHVRSLESQHLLPTADALQQLGDVDEGPGDLDDADVGKYVDRPTPPRQDSADLRDEYFQLFDEHGQPTIPFPSGRPPLPQIESLHSRTALADLLAYLHSRLLQIAQSRDSAAPSLEVLKEQSRLGAVIPWPLWHQLLNLEAELAQYLKEVSEPE